MVVDFAIQLLEMVCVLAHQQEYIDIFIKQQAMVVISVCFNLMQTRHSEIELIMENPTEFVNLALDCCDKQQSQIIKTQACKLLECMCDNVDGAATCVTTFACNALHMAL